MATGEAPLERRTFTDENAFLADSAPRWNLVGVSGAVVCLALLAAAFAANLQHFVYTWRTDDNYSHGFLVPLIALYFAREAMLRGPITPSRGAWIGAPLIVIAMLGKLATVFVPIGIVSDLAFLLALAGTCSWLLGRRGLVRFAFALAFLAFMVPLPIPLYAALASPLQLTVSRIASGLLNALGIPVLCQGNMMTLPGDVRMFVAEACSGMRQLTGFLALTTAVAWLGNRPSWYRAILVASSIPIAMTANVIRVVLTGWIMYRLDPRYAAGTFHTFEGLLLMGLGLAILSVECALLNMLSGPSRVPTATKTTVGRVLSPLLPTPPRAASCAALLVVCLAAESLAERAVESPRPEPVRPLSTLPLRLGTWVGRDAPVASEILEKSQADQWLNRVYEDRAHPGRTLTLWINYSKHGLNLRHTPEICLPSGGWTKLESQCSTFDVERSGGRRVAATRLAYSQGELVQGIGFWYYIFGEGAVEHFVRSLPITSRSSHGRTTRGSGLTVEVFCPGDADPEGEALREFARALLDELEPLLPEPRAEYHVP